jgi:hypothetical protein
LINFITGLVGCFLLFYGLYSAIFCGSSYWYSYFVLGLFLFLDRCDALINHDSNLARLFNKNWRNPVYTYIIYLAGALFLDLLLGSHMGNLWVYPHFDFMKRLINVILIGYPLAFFSCAALYRVLNKLFEGLRKKSFKHNNNITPNIRFWVKIILVFTVLSTLFPIIYFNIFGKRYIQEVIFICGLIGIFSLSPLSLILGKLSLLGGILNKDWSTIIALLISIPINAFAHELPNTFAWEWRYQNMPFASLEILGIPVVVLTVGWTYLTIFGISGNELFFNESN